MDMGFALSVSAVMAAVGELLECEGGGWMLMVVGVGCAALDDLLEGLAASVKAHR